MTAVILSWFHSGTHLIKEKWFCQWFQWLCSCSNQPILLNSSVVCNHGNKHHIAHYRPNAAFSQTPCNSSKWRGEGVHTSIKGSRIWPYNFSARWGKKRRREGLRRRWPCSKVYILDDHPKCQGKLFTVNGFGFPYNIWKCFAQCDSLSLNTIVIPQCGVSCWQQ